MWLMVVMCSADYDCVLREDAWGARDVEEASSEKLSETMGGDWRIAVCRGGEDRTILQDGADRHDRKAFCVYLNINPKVRKGAGPHVGMSTG